jgi:putative transposase
VELNMVRCGAVSHPREWNWVGYDEIMGIRQRYRLVDVERLCWRLGTSDIEEVKRNLKAALAEAIVRGEVKREPCWTESLAVGSAAFVEKVRLTEVVQTVDGLTVLQESAVPYGQESSPKSGANEPN